MDHEIDRDEQKAGEDQQHCEALEPPEVPGADGDHDERSRDEDPGCLVESEIVERQRDADELGDDGQAIEQEQVDHAERAPELAETLEYEPRMADAGDRAQAQHHLLIDVENRDQQRHRPEQRGAVILARLAIGREGAGVIVARHDDEAWAQDRHERDELMFPGLAGGDVAMQDGTEGALDVADVRFIENRAAGLVGIYEDGHDLPPCRTGAEGKAEVRPFSSLAGSAVGCWVVGSAQCARRNARGDFGGPPRVVAHV